MLKSLSGLALRAENLIRAWNSWSQGTLIDALNTNGGPRQVLHIRAVQSQAEAYATTAKALIDEANFSTLDADVQTDVKAIFEELTLAIADMKAETDPDLKWAAADGTSKFDASSRMLVGNANSDRFKARLRGELRGQVPPTPKPIPPGQNK